MKRASIAVLLLAFALTARSSFAQSSAAPPAAPLDRAEILGRLATGYSPSYVAYLVKTRGLGFAVTAGFLDQVREAGGAGILLDNLPHATSPASIGYSEDGASSVDHLAKCAALTHIGDYDAAHTECRAAIEESPSSPWPLLVSTFSLPFVSPHVSGNDSFAAMQKEEQELLRRANALIPPSPPSKLPQVPAGFGGIALTTEQTAAMARELLDNDEANSREMLSSELFTLAQGPAALEPPDTPTMPAAPAIEIPPGLQARMNIEPDLASNHWSLAQLYDEQAHDFENARNELLEAVRLEPDYQKWHVRLVSLYLARGDLNGTVAELREVVRITPEGILERRALARTLELVGKPEEAVAEYKFVLARHPDNVETSDALVDLYVEEKDFGSAVGELRRSLDSSAPLQASESDFVTFRWNDEVRLALLLETNHDFERAAQHYRYLLRFRPDDPDLHNDYGILLAQQNRCSDAIAEFNASIRLTDTESDSSYPRSNVALCLATQKDYAGALRELKTIMESEPASALAENNVAWIYATAQDPAIRNPAEALRLARLAVDSSTPPEAFMLDTLAEALLINGKSREALETERKAVALDPANTEIQSRLERFENAAAQSSR